MKPGDRVQAKKFFRLRNAIVDQVDGARVQVRHDVWVDKWPDVEAKQRAQSPRSNERPIRTMCRAVDIFDMTKLKVIHG